jgi:hypothetical protein
MRRVYLNCFRSLRNTSVSDECLVLGHFVSGADSSLGANGSG